MPAPILATKLYIPPPRPKAVPRVRLIERLNEKHRGRDIVAVTHGGTIRAALGLALGIPAAIGAGKLMNNQLFGVKPWDPIVLGLAALMLGLAALLASAIPARRAAGVEPMVALRNG